MTLLLPCNIQLLSDTRKNELFRQACENQLGESCMLTGICENLQCIFSSFHLIWIKFLTQDVHKIFLSNYVFCENQFSEIPYYPFKVKIVWETAHDAVAWACTVGHILKYRSASCCCHIFPQANYVDPLVLQLSTYTTVRRNWNLSESLYFAWSRMTM
jgi:hypothetical protein